MTNRNAPSMGNYGATWEHGGYAGCGPVESLLDSLRGQPAAVCGNAHTVFDDFQSIEAMEGLVVFAVNDIGAYLHRVDHFVSLHTDKIPLWMGLRQRESERSGCRVHSERPLDGQVDYVWEKLTPMMALSGMFAAQIAYLMGCDPIILCGCPGSVSRRFFDIRPRDTFGYGGGDQRADINLRKQLTNEMERVPEFKNRMRSQSGWNREYFGAMEAEHVFS